MPLKSSFLVLLCLFSVRGRGQWIAPEGKIINYRTLVWSDFLGRPDKDADPRVGAEVRPVIYATMDSAEEHPGGRVTFSFHVKCAFQSAAWVKESVGKEHTYYYLNHEQDHYDIALNYANKLKTDLTGRDYSIKDYEKELNAIYKDALEKYEKTQENYDNECDHSLIKELQELWDLRIKKCLENISADFYSSPLNALQTEKLPGQMVKRMPGEPAVQFAVRCRPLYSEISDELVAKILETREWTAEKAIIAFYTQRYTQTVDDGPPRDCERLLGCIFMTTGNNMYKRVMIDTFTNEDKPAKIASVFFANADTDKTKELIIMTTGDRRDKQITGTLYNTRVYDNTFARIFPARLRRLDDISGKLDGGWEGTVNNKPSKARFRTPKEITETLVKMGYPQ